MRQSLWSLLLILVTVVAATGAQPAEAVPAALRSQRRVPQQDQPHQRYLWLREDDPKWKQLLYRTVSGHCNHLSRRRRLIAPVLILTDDRERTWPQVADVEWKDATLVRVDLRSYGWTPEIWDRLGELDRFFHVIQEAPYPAGEYQSGRKYPAGVERVAALAPWLIEPLGLPEEPAARRREKELRLGYVVDLARMCGAQCPIIDAGNFVWQTAVNADRKAGYYDWLGVKDKKGFDALVGFNETTALDFAFPILEAVNDSDVNQRKLRRIEIWEKIAGRYILTKDSLKPATGKRSPLEAIGRNELEFDAFEVFANGSNGLWKMLLADRDGKLQDSAPDQIGYHRRSADNDGRIHVYLTCLHCHDSQPGRGSMQPFRPYFRNLYAAGGQAALASYSATQLKALEEEYLTPIDLEPDQRRHVRALLDCTGWQPHQYASHLYEVYHAEARQVTRARAAAECGVTEDVFAAALERHLKVHGQLSNTLAGFTKADGSLPIEAWIEHKNFAELALRGYATWPQDLRHKYPRR